MTDIYMRRGLTIIEIVIVMALLAILLAAAIIKMDPVGQFARARNSQREFHLNALANAIRQNIADSSVGSFTCVSGDIPTSTKKMAVGAGNYDIGPCLMPVYIVTLPFDPKLDGAHFTSLTDYDTGYSVSKSTSSGEITLSAPGAELGKTVSVIR